MGRGNELLVKYREASNKSTDKDRYRRDIPRDKRCHYRVNIAREFFFLRPRFVTHVGSEHGALLAPQMSLMDCHFSQQAFACFWLFTAACSAARSVLLEQEDPEETSVYAACSTMGFAGTLGLRTAHCCNFPGKAAQKNMSPR